MGIYVAEVEHMPCMDSIPNTTLPLSPTQTSTSTSRNGPRPQILIGIISTIDKTLLIIQFCFGGPTHEVLRGYSWLCTENSLLVDSGPYEMPRIKPGRPRVRRTSYLLCYCSAAKPMNDVDYRVSTEAKVLVWSAWFNCGHHFVP